MNTIEEYFARQQEILFDEKLRLEKEFIKIQNQIKETDKFVELLEEKSDPNFESFTPRDVNIKNKYKIKNLQEERKKLLEIFNNTKLKMEDCKFKIEELQCLVHNIKVEKSETDQYKKMEEQNMNQKMDVLHYLLNQQEVIVSEFVESVLNQIVDENHKIKLILQLADVDKERSKIELKQLGNSIESLENDIRKSLKYEKYLSDHIHIIEKFKKYVDKISKNYDCKIESFFDKNIKDYDVIISNAIFEIVKYIIESIRKKSDEINLSCVKSNDKTIFCVLFKTEVIENIGIIETFIKNNNKICTYSYLISIRVNYEIVNNTSAKIYFEI